MSVHPMDFVRLVPYWVTILLALFFYVSSIFFVAGTTKGAEWYDEWIGNVFDGIDPMLTGGNTYAFIVTIVVSPLVVSASIAALLVTKRPLPVFRTSWITKVFALLPWFEGRQKNQFYKGDLDMNIMGALVSIVPGITYFLGFTFTQFYKEKMDPEYVLAGTSINLGIASGVAAIFFLVPVARHSSVLHALGWNPIHAMRIHIISGWAMFWLAMLHGILYLPVYFIRKNKEGGESVWNQIIPRKECWYWDNTWRTYNNYDCGHKMYAISGYLCGCALIVFVLLSHPYVRRNYYRIFYLSHVILAPLLLIGLVWHWNICLLLFIPSVCYYLASTSPTLMQALAVMVRGGHKIVHAKEIPDAGGCVDLAIAITADASHLLHTETNQFVKLCAPNLSIVWHPLTAIVHPEDPTTMRIIFRPIGSFTRALADCCLDPSSPPPKLLIDAFYRGDNMALRAMQDHDHLTIVAGGITITPFLTLLPTLLTNMIKEGNSDQVKLRSIVIHWACRERGLQRYIQENYLDFFQRQAHGVASVIPDFEYVVKIYQTGTEKMNLIEEKDVEETEKFDTSSNEDSSEQQKQNRHDSGSNKNDDIMAGTGVEVELARLMPGRFSALWKNLPAFIMMGTLLWLSFWMGWKWLYDRSTGYPGYKESKAFGNHKVTACWALCLFVVTMFPAALFMETIALAYKKYWPTEVRSFEDIEVYRTVSDTQAEHGTNVQSNRVTVETLMGRPTTDQIFASAREPNVEEPGIYLCAPYPLMESVKKEAGKENNKYLLKTRYCIYDEPFEF